MNIWKVSIENIKSKPLYTVLSVFILSLSIALLLGIQQLKNSFKNQIDNNVGNIDLVIGAKGSPLQLILASVLHLDNPTGNIPYHEALKIKENPMVKSATPISYGDNHKGYRIVGTTNDFISLYNAELESGREVKKSMEVVLGNTVATQLNLKIGNKILSSHGLIDNNVDVHTDELTIVGILKPTKRVIDRLIITSLESVWDVHNHGDHEGHEDHEDHEGHEEHESHQDHEDHDHEDHEDHDEEREITSLLVTFKSPRALLTFPRKINKQTNMQAVLPKYELDKLYNNTGIGFKAIAGFAYLILIISGVILFSSLYKMVKERAFELAILRTYGANNFQLIKIVAYEGLMIGLTAFTLGFLFLKISLSFIFSIIKINKNSYVLQELSFLEILNTLVSVFIIIVISIVMAIYPILKMDVSKILSNEK